MNKLFTLVVDDDESDIILKIIENSLLKNHCEKAVCEWVETIPQSFKKQKIKTAIDVIKERNKKQQSLDFAFIDVQFEDEFGDDMTSVGANKVISELQKYYPKCRIIVLSKNEGVFLDRYAEFNGIKYPTIRKTATQEYHNIIIERELETWVRLKCLQIATENKGKEIAELLNAVKLNWGAELKFKNEVWSLENLFFFFKSKKIILGKEIYKTIAPNIIEFPIVRAERGGDKWNKPSTSQFKLPLKDYYIEFYFNFYPRLSEIETEAKEFLNLFYLATFEKRLKEENLLHQFINNKRANGLGYSVNLLDFNANPSTLYSTMNNFQDKLFVRLIFWGCYIFLTTPVDQFLNLFSWGRISEDNNDTLKRGKKKKESQIANNKLLSTHFWIKDLYDVTDIKKRNQDYLFHTLCSGDERRFLIQWWKELNATGNQLSSNKLLQENYEYIRIQQS